VHAVPYGRQQHDHQTEDVEERSHRDALPLSELAGIRQALAHEPLDVRQQVAMREHGTLRNAGGAARVLDDGEVRSRLDRGRWCESRRARQDIVERRVRVRQVRALAGYDDVEERGRVAHRTDRWIGCRVDDDSLRLRALEDVGELPAHVDGVHLGDDRPEPDHREEGNQVLHGVRQHEGHPVALAHTACREGRGEPSAQL